MKLITKSNPVWQRIIADNKDWCSRGTLKFFGSTIFWASLKETPAGYVFITSERNYGHTGEVFSVRLVSKTGIETIGEYGQYETLREALRAI